MKTFLTHINENALGPSIGQFYPVADLNAQKTMLGPNKAVGTQRELKKSDLDQLEKYADRLFASVGIDVEFTRHFLDRVNDLRNTRQITSSELTRLFKQSFKKYGKTIAKLGPDAEAVINDMRTDINMPFVLNLKGGQLELVAKTVMRKKNFKTSNPKLSFEQLVKEEMQFFPKNLHERITLPQPPADLQKEAGKLKGIIENRTEEDEESIRLHDENSFYAIEQYCKKNGLIFHDNEMKDIVVQAKPTIKYFKETFNVPRPHEVDSSIKPMSSVTNKTKAYPSGHACQSMLVGLYVASKFPEHEKGVIAASKEAGLGRVKAGFHYLADFVAGNLLAEKMFMVMNKDNYGKYIDETARIPRKKGQPAKSDKHSDLYTDENPVGTIHGLKFATVKDAEASVKKIEGSGKTHAHKIQAAIAMEQRAKEMGKTAEAAVYRRYIEKMKKITKQKNESINESKLYSKYHFIFSYKDKEVKLSLSDFYNYNQFKIFDDMGKKLGLRKDHRHLMKIERPKDVPIPSNGDIVIVNNKPYNIDRQKNHRDGNISFGAISTDTFVKEVLKKKNNYFMFQRSIDLYNDVDKIIKKDSSEYKKLISKMMKENAPSLAVLKKKIKSGTKLGSTETASAKARGLIPRSDGTKRKSDKYK